MIRISTENKHYFHQDKEKFRFHTMRTFNGSSNSNCRSPQIYEENDSFFPDINFFRTTPTPQTLTPPHIPSAARPPVSQPLPSAQKSDSAPTDPTSVPTGVSVFKKSSNSPEKFPETFHRTSTPRDPYRCTKSQVVLQKSPSPSQPSSGQVPASESFASASSSTVLTSPALSSSALSSQSPPRTPAPESRIRLTAEDREALKQLLLVYK